jgi:hypothetical protein
MATSQEFQAKLKQGDIATALKLALGDIIELKITTSVVPAESPESATGVHRYPQMQTHINIVDGDIETEVDRRFLNDGPYAELRDFHTQQVLDGQQIIKSNIDSLQTLCGIFLQTSQTLGGQGPAPIDQPHSSSSGSSSSNVPLSSSASTIKTPDSPASSKSPVPTPKADKPGTEVEMGDVGIDTNLGQGISLGIAAVAVGAVTTAGHSSSPLSDLADSGVSTPSLDKTALNLSAPSPELSVQDAPCVDNPDLMDSPDLDMSRDVSSSDLPNEELAVPDLDIPAPDIDIPAPELDPLGSTLVPNLDIPNLDVPDFGGASDLESSPLDLPPVESAVLDVEPADIVPPDMGGALDSENLFGEGVEAVIESDLELASSPGEELAEPDELMPFSAEVESVTAPPSEIPDFGEEPLGEEPLGKKLLDDSGADDPWSTPIAAEPLQDLDWSANEPPAISGIGPTTIDEPEEPLVDLEAGPTDVTEGLLDGGLLDAEREGLSDRGLMEDPPREDLPLDFGMEALAEMPLEAPPSAEVSSEAALEELPLAFADLEPESSDFAEADLIEDSIGESMVVESLDLEVPPIEEFSPLLAETTLEETLEEPLKVSSSDLLAAPLLEESGLLEELALPEEPGSDLEFEPLDGGRDLGGLTGDLDSALDLSEEIGESSESLTLDLPSALEEPMIPDLTEPSEPNPDFGLEAGIPGDLETEIPDLEIPDLSLDPPIDLPDAPDEMLLEEAAAGDSLGPLEIPGDLADPLADLELEPISLASSDDFDLSSELTTESQEEPNLDDPFADLDLSPAAPAQPELEGLKPSEPDLTQSGLAEPNLAEPSEVGSDADLDVPPLDFGSDLSSIDLNSPTPQPEATVLNDFDSDLWDEAPAGTPLQSEPNQLLGEPALDGELEDINLGDMNIEEETAKSLDPLDDLFGDSPLDTGESTDRDSEFSPNDLESIQEDPFGKLDMGGSLDDDPFKGLDALEDDPFANLSLEDD